MLDADIMIIGGTAWSAENQTSQQMVRAAARLTSGNVLYFYRDVQTNFFRAILKRQWSELRRLRWKPTHFSEGRLHVISLSGLNAFLPLAVSRMTRNLRTWIFRRDIMRAIAVANIEPGTSVAIVYWWHFPTLWRQVGIKKVIFDLIDDHAALGMNLGRTRHNHFTSQLIAETSTCVDAVTIVSAALVDVLPQSCESMLIPNAIDIALAESKLNVYPNGSDRATLQRCAKTTIVFVGGAVGRVDWGLVANVASARPEWRFLFVGPTIPPGLDRNVVSIESLPYGEVLRLLRVCHLGWIPFASNSLTRASDFMKTWDYRIAGLRVVATELPSTLSAAAIDDAIVTVNGSLDAWLTAIDNQVARATAEGLCPISKEAVTSRNTDTRLLSMLSLVGTT